MVAKCVILFALLAAVSADFSSFSYGVADPYTGDFKHQFETRNGERVQGQYALLDSDGTQRTVDYAAGAEGFNALVRKDPAVVAPIARVAPIAPIAPISPLGLRSYAPYAPYAYGRYGGYGYPSPYYY
ncbi:larval/pupal rigid cuticle protein 66-like [Pieris napi]|uniref:larval/pupal rigid cuticle protein 66-like n=1 Tax=Pieris napi TaxID=78633 RepID=UPI001FBA54CD|nr:larval/pupal rigid cuticle protein 66-like [Pieris napi]